VPQILLTECISARDLSTILEGMADSLSFTAARRPSPSMCAELGAVAVPSIPGRQVAIGGRIRDADARHLPRASCFRNEMNNDIWWKHLRATIVNHSI
jgi:hypothetical protein